MDRISRVQTDRFSSLDTSDRRISQTGYEGKSPTSQTSPLHHLDLNRVRKLNKGDRSLDRTFVPPAVLLPPMQHTAILLPNMCDILKLAHYRSVVAQTRSSAPFFVEYLFPSICPSIPPFRVLHLSHSIPNISHIRSQPLPADRVSYRARRRPQRHVSPDPRKSLFTRTANPFN